MNVFILLGSEIFLACKAAINRAGHVEAAVSDAFYLAYLAEHGSDLCLGFVTQVRIAHFIQVVCYLNFHVVADSFVFLNAAIYL